MMPAINGRSDIDVKRSRLTHAILFVLMVPAGAIEIELAAA
jgi:hypothetical protein